MWIQQQTKVKVFGAAMILALTFVCSIAAFAAITASSTSLQFPSQAVGTKSAPISVTISNTSRDNITITSASMPMAQFSYSGPAFPITLTVGHSFTGSVTFTPSAAQNYSGVLRFMRRGGAPLVGVRLSGTGIQATAPTTSLIASPSAIAFSAQAGGAAPAAQSLTIGANPAGALPFTVSADQSWITVSATSGTTSAALQVGANISGLAAGNYSGHVIVSAAGVTNSPVSIPVTLAVTAGPGSTLISFQNALPFSAQAGGAALGAQTLTIVASPAAALPITTTVDQSWITVTGGTGTTKAMMQIGVNTTGLTAGSYSGHVLVASTGAINSPLSIPVTLVITGAQTKALTAAPSALSFSAQAGGAAPAAQSLTIGENPAGALPFTVSADQAWMTLSAASGTTSSAIQVGANISGLAAGNYTGHVITTAAGVTNSPMSVTVTLAVTAAQTSLLSVNPTNVAFGSINLGNNNTKTVTITNSGTGSVAISQVAVAGAGMSANGISAPMTLTAGQTTALSIVFAPAAIGAVNGTVSVVSNATNSPGVITATGTGAQPQLSASPATLNFGSVTVGSNGSQTITLSNTGSAAATISQAVAAGTGYTISGLTIPMSLAAGASTSFSVQFAPTAAGSDSGSVTVTSNTPNSPTLVALNGTGTAAIAHSVSLSWVASTSTVVGYNVYRGSVSGGPYTLLNSTPGAALSYTDNSVVAGQTYFYVVTAVTSAGMESVVSNEVSVLIPTP